MKRKLFITLCIYGLLVSCHKESNYILTPVNKLPACSSLDPLNELSWLHDLALKSMSDHSGNYVGRIWIKSYKDRDLIVTDMMLGSGGVAYHVFDCKGSPFLLPELSFYNSLTDEDMVFDYFKAIKQK